LSLVKIFDRTEIDGIFLKSSWQLHIIKQVKGSFLKIHDSHGSCL